MPPAPPPFQPGRPLPPPQRPGRTSSTVPAGDDCVRQAGPPRHRLERPLAVRGAIAENGDRQIQRRIRPDQRPCRAPVAVRLRRRVFTGPMPALAALDLPTETPV